VYQKKKKPIENPVTRNNDWLSVQMPSFARILFGSDNEVEWLQALTCVSRGRGMTCWFCVCFFFLQ
jgi:hypothetical protein